MAVQFHCFRRQVPSVAALPPKANSSAALAWQRFMLVSVSKLNKTQRDADPSVIYMNFSGRST